MLSVGNEVGRLRQVLLHEPGPEVDSMVPAMMEDLLFDDILFGERAREEHRRFRRVLQILGVRTWDMRQMLVEALEQPGAREWVLEILLSDIPGTVRPGLAELPAVALAQVLIGGMRRDASPQGIEVADLFAIPPLPNACFQRDPQVVVGDGVVFGAMKTPARYREALLARAVFRFHPALATAPVVLDPLEPGRNPLLLGLHRPCLEGGDVEVLSPDVVVVGHSERTNRAGIHYLARALARRENGPRWLVVADLPRRRAYMHLDTVMTAVDRDACLVHHPVICEGGYEQARAYTIDLHDASLLPVGGTGLLPVLAACGIDLKPIPCGGVDPVQQQREQWTDGANALAIAPGVIVLYDRNVATAEALSLHGFRVISADDLLLGREELRLDEGGRTCILLPSHELSRARGGPHCLSHALARDGI